ncbi:hypothetical protein N7494_011921 [Penicillium frequentans]|uniref:Uncharacterized protein n=1 Tax=Penicillium frequentans TaxID=3151616 RepID=A0AAD6CL70_9EURO|nr:hypothetical protein N7494_011921 [Penicillium glabrum]
MGWDKVIQDSDEEEPLIEDDFPVSPDPLQDPEPPTAQHHDHIAQQETYPNEHTTTEGFPGPQLNVNFDQFLQSQGTHTGSTASQQQREERWIPSTNEGGGGSISAMMTEIGLAQERLFDDASSGAQRVPATVTFYPSEISQPGSFPTMQSYQYQQMNPVTHGQFGYSEVPNNAPYEATQLLVPGVAPAYDYSTPTASTHVDSPSDGFTGSTSIQTGENLHDLPLKQNLQPPQPMQPMACSPHDTEPLSSVASPGLSKTIQDNTRSGLVSPQHSPASTYDELALPAVYVEVPSAVKRARQTKKPLPEDDDDDELAIVGGPQPSSSKLTAKSLPENNPQAASVESPSKHVPENVIASENGGTGAENTPVVDEVGSADKTNIPPTLPDNSSKSSTKEPKIKKSKRTKAASAISKARVSDADDDVIWVDSRPLASGETEEQKNPGTESITADPNHLGTPQPDPTASTEESSTTTKSGDKPAPKKRGRKRKQPLEQPREAAPTQITEEQGLPSNSKIVVLKVNTNPAGSSSDPKHETKAVEAENSMPPPQADPPVPQANDQSEAPPQTPSGPDQNPSTPVAGSISTQKGPAKHSPISSTSKVPYRVGLSKRARIAPLLKIVRK